MSILSNISSLFVRNKDPRVDALHQAELQRIGGLLSAMGTAQGDSIFDGFDAVSRASPYIERSYNDTLNKIRQSDLAEQQRKEAMSFQKQLQDERLANERYLMAMRLSGLRNNNGLNTLFTSTPDSSGGSIPPIPSVPPISPVPPATMPSPIQATLNPDEADVPIPIFKEDLAATLNPPITSGVTNVSNVNKAVAAAATPTMATSTTPTTDKYKVNMMTMTGDINKQYGDERDAMLNKMSKIDTSDSPTGGIPAKSQLSPSEDLKVKSLPIIDRYNRTHNGLGDTLYNIATYNLPPDLLFKQLTDPSAYNNAYTALKQINPDFHPDGFKNKQQLYNELNNSKGATRQLLVSANTAYKHLNNLESDYDKLNNSSLKPFNWTVNEIEQLLGSNPYYTKANADLDTFNAENEKLLLGGKPTVASLKKADSEISVNDGPTQMHSYINARRKLFMERAIAGLRGAAASSGANTTAFPNDILDNGLLNDLSNHDYIQIKGNHFYLKDKDDSDNGNFKHITYGVL